MTLLREFRPGLWLTELPLEGFDVRGAVIVGARRTLIWDTLSHPRDMVPLAPLLQGREIGAVYSHADWDHCWGTAGLPGRPNLVVGHAACLSRFMEDVPATLQKKRAAQSGAWDDVALIPPDLTFEGELALDLGGVSLWLYSLPGHTPDSIVGLIPEWGVLLAGDTIETPLPVLQPGSPVEQWIAGLGNWECDRRVQTVIPAHGVIGGREIIRQTATYLRVLLDGKADVPGALGDFYRETHEANLSYVKGGLSA